MQLKSVLFLGFTVSIFSVYASTVEAHTGRCIRATKAAGALNGIKPEARDTIRILDTNILYSHPEILNQYADGTLIFPLTVLEEVDNHKHGHEPRNESARAISRTLRELRAQNSSKSGNVLSLARGGELILVDPSPRFKWGNLKQDKPDHRIIALAKEMQDRNPGKKVVVMSNDGNLRTLAEAYGIETADQKTTVDAESTKAIISGPVIVEVSDENFLQISDSDTMTVQEADRFGLPQDIRFFDNQFVIFRKQSGGEFNLEDGLSATWRFHELKDGRKVLSPISRDRKDELRNILGIRPRNEGQIQLADVLFDRSIGLITVTGTAGTGKNLLTIAAALKQSQLTPGKSRFKHIILTRAYESTGKEIGYLPGNEKEKMAPFVQPVSDNIQVIVETLRENPRDAPHFEELSLGNGVAVKPNGNGDKHDGHTLKPIGLKELLNPNTDLRQGVERLMATQMDVLAIAFTRGRTWTNTLVIVDEAQNLTPHEAKTLVTRAGEGTTIVLIGDLNQIDKQSLTKSNNGIVILAHAFLNALRNDPLGTRYSGVSHVNLTEGERSALSKKAAEILQ